jgi:hypothetical protein
MWKGKQKAKVPTRTIYKVLNRCFQPAVPLCLILRFPIRYRLPLHIERCICSAAFERMDVIDDVSGTAAAGSPVSHPEAHQQHDEDDDLERITPDSRTIRNESGHNIRPQQASHRYDVRKSVTSLVVAAGFSSIIQ